MSRIRNIESQLHFLLKKYLHCPPRSIPLFLKDPLARSHTPYSLPIPHKEISITHDLLQGHKSSQSSKLSRRPHTVSFSSLNLDDTPASLSLESSEMRGTWPNAWSTCTPNLTWRAEKMCRTPPYHRFEVILRCSNYSHLRKWKVSSKKRSAGSSQGTCTTW